MSMPHAYEFIIYIHLHRIFCVFGVPLVYGSAEMFPMICKRTQLFILSQMILLIESRNRLVFFKQQSKPFLSYQLESRVELELEFSWALSANQFHLISSVLYMCVFYVVPSWVFLTIAWVQAVSWLCPVSVAVSWTPLFKELGAGDAVEEETLIRKRSSHLLALSLRWNLTVHVKFLVFLYIIAMAEEPFLAFLVSM